MKKGVYSMCAVLNFEGLTLEDAARLETYLQEGLYEKDWGPVKITTDLSLVGETEARGNRPISHKKLLKMEKDGASKNAQK